MLHQRIYGLEFCAKYSNAKYILALDDDVKFDSKYAEKAIEIMSRTNCDILAPAVLDKQNPCLTKESPWSLSNLLTSIKGLRFISNNSPFRIKIMRNGGVKVNTILRGVFPTQSFHGSGVWFKNGCVNDLDLKSEYWVEGCRYALPDDQVIGYKAYLKGKNILYTTEVSHFHLDAGTSTGKDRKFHRAFAFGRNFIIFWHRFILSQSTCKIERIQATIAICQRYFFQTFSALITGIFTFDFSSVRGLLSGIKEGIDYVYCDEYTNLPKIDKKM